MTVPLLRDVNETVQSLVRELDDLIVKATG
jgi:hypothetical protein